MSTFIEAQNKRLIKQLLMSVIFVAVLVVSWHWPILGFFIPACMIAGIAIGLFRGRKWCDWYCPRGSFYDSLMKRLSPSKAIPDWMRQTTARVIILVVLFSYLIVQIVRAWGSLNAVAHVFVILLTVTTSVGILMALFINQRAWCSICPVGTMLNLIARKKGRLMIDSKRCVECKVCAKVCPVGLKPFTAKTDVIKQVNQPDCLSCGLCVAACPTKALSFATTKKT